MLLLVPFLVFGVSPLSSGAEAAVLDAPTRHVRAESGDARRVLGEGYRRSLTFALLIDRLQASDVTVYVALARVLPPPLLGRSELVSGARYSRYVRIDVRQAPNPEETIALVAHELQHALEIADARDVIDEAALERLYKRIGTSSGPEMFETRRAIETERQVREELRHGIHGIHGIFE